MGKNKSGGFKGNSPRDDPIPMRFNSFGGFCGAEMKFKISDVFDGPVVCDCGVQARENSIKVDRLSCQDIVSLRIWEFWDKFRSENHMLGHLKIKYVILNKFASEFLARSKDRSVGFVIRKPGKKCFVRGAPFS